MVAAVDDKPLAPQLMAKSMLPADTHRGVADKGGELRHIDGGGGMQAEVDVVARTGLAYCLYAFVAPGVQVIRPAVGVEVNVVQSVGRSPCQCVLERVPPASYPIRSRKFMIVLVLPSS